MENTNHNILPDEVNANDEELQEIDSMTIDEIVAENERRNAALKVEYDPITGVGCCKPRVPYAMKNEDGTSQIYLIPETMANELETIDRNNELEWQLLRLHHDFEYWCATCVTILDKVSGRLVKLVLNRPQRRVLQILEQQRLSNSPLRLIMLKARQWGGSTLVQMYMIWIQLVLKKNWNSLICGHLQQTSAAIKSMYTRVLRHYPRRFAADGKRIEFTAFEGSRNVRQLSVGESLVITGSAQNQDAVRGYDVKMAHLTEVAFWPDTTQHSPDDLIRSISGTVPLEPMTMVVLESTANGVGNYFHSEWLRAKSGVSDKAPVFVPWHEIEIYRHPVADVQQLVAELDDYEKQLWQSGSTLEMINWYHHKRREYSSQVLMAAEFPSTDIEAFSLTSRNVFDPNTIESMRDTCNEEYVTGDMMPLNKKTIVGAEFVKSLGSNLMKVWKMPEKSDSRNKYIVAVDVGGRNEDADWSVISVLDTHNDDDNGCPEVVAQWRGHLDKDMMAWKAAQIARFYNNALLVFESNTLECDGEIGQTIFDSIGYAYSNLYYRTNKSGQRYPGFHTNTATKKDAIANLIAYVRDKAYIERDNLALNEMTDYEYAANGKGYGARRGSHDDILMTRAIALLIIEEMGLNRHKSRAKAPANFMKDDNPMFFG